MYHSLFLVIWILYALPGLSALEDYPAVKTCEGLRGRSEGGNSEPVRWHKQLYENCTHIRFHLLISMLTDDHDVSFLQSIQEVDGSVIFLFNNVSRLSLPNLRVVRGRYLYKYHGEKSAALLIAENIGTGSKPAVLDLRSLRSVVNGKIVVIGNKNFCYLNDILWSALPESKSPGSQLHFEGNRCPAKAPEFPCHDKCPRKDKKLRCWGPSEAECQKLGTLCSKDTYCETRRCYSSGRSESCCHEQCAGACYGKPKQCDSCRKLLNGKVCVESCPGEFIVTKYTRKKNPAFRRELGSFCVKECPRNFFTHGTMCLKVCQQGYYADKDNKCVECPKNDSLCDGHCHIEDLKEALIKEKKWPVSKKKRPTFTDRFLLEKIAGCRTLQTQRISINSMAVSLKARQHRVRLQDLQHLRNLERITGCLHLDLRNFPTVESLNFLSKLESLSCSVNDEGLDIKKGDGLRYLDLVRLTDLRVAKVNLRDNPKLCYLDNFRNHFTPSYTKEFKTENVSSREECASAGHKCDPQCVSETGCWGPGRRRCVRCRHMRAGSACVKNCEDEPGFFTDRVKNSCRACHRECQNCTGPNATQCVGACRHVKDGAHCVASCPSKAFNNKGVCTSCATNCSQTATTTAVCTGSKALPGRGGCNFCKYIEVNATLHPIRCLKGIPSTDFYTMPIPGHDPLWQRLSKYTNRDSLTSILCGRCDPACRICTDKQPNSCSECSRGYFYFKERRHCVAKCPAYSFKSNSSHCIACHPYCRSCNGSTANDCISCQWRTLIGVNGSQCVKTCPKSMPHDRQDPKTGETYCSKTSSSKFTKASFSLGLIPLALLVVGGVCCCYQRRRRLAFMKDRELLRARYTRRLEEEMVPLASSNVAPNFGQIRVIGGKRLQKLSKLGHGAFGTVYRGRWFPEREEGDEIDVKIDVAIKELRHTSTATDSKNFLSEAHVMASVNNPFCVHLLGVCLTTPMQLISEFVPLGNLTSYVPRHRQSLTSRLMLTWSLQIAKGMAYLESRGIVHRDLAARNVLLQKPDLVRITDFGLAKLLDSGDELRSTASERLPVPWLAIESLTELSFSHKSDVWAYGITLWEIFTFCESLPYSMKLDKLIDFLDSGERLDQPASCTLDLYMLLLKCWVREPSGRPTFEEIVDEVKMMAADPERFLSSQTSTSSKPTKKAAVERPSSFTPSTAGNEYLDPIRSLQSDADVLTTKVNEVNDEDSISRSGDSGVEAYLLPEVHRAPNNRLDDDNGYLAVTTSPA